MKGMKESLLASIVLLFAFCMRMPFSLYEGCMLLDRMLYQASHANLFHLVGNCWCLYLIRRSGFRSAWYMWVLAYLISVAVPASHMPTVGISGVLYAVMGMISWQAAERMKFHAWTIGFMSVGLLFPEHINNMLHAWCYAFGVVVGITLIEDCSKRR